MMAIRLGREWHGIMYDMSFGRFARGLVHVRRAYIFQRIHMYVMLATSYWLENWLHVADVTRHVYIAE